MGIISDKFILLDVSVETSTEKVRRNLHSEEGVIQFPEEDCEGLAEAAIREYRLHIEGVKEVCRGQIIELDGNKHEGVILEEIARILKLQRSRAPRRPPRVLIMGPPGCGKTLYAQAVAKKYQLQYVKVSHIVKDLIRTEGKSARGKELQQRLDTCTPCKNSD